MNRSTISNSSSRYHSTISKNSNVSVSSILRDSSTGRPKKQNSVRFEDSPVEIQKTITINLSNICSKLKSPSPSCTSVSIDCKNPKPKANSSNNNNEKPRPQSKNISTSSPTKKSPVKAYSIQSVQEPQCDTSQITDSKFGPKLLNYAFRNNGFYEKLSKFYEKTPEEKVASTKASPPKVSIKLRENSCDNSFLQGNDGKFKTVHVDSLIIHLKPCASYQESSAKEKEARLKSLSPTRQSKPNLRKKSQPGATILN